jgi:hypothetical protein
VEARRSTIVIVLHELVRPGWLDALQHDQFTATNPTLAIGSLYPPAVGGLQPRPIIHPDGRRHTDDDSEEDEDEEDFEDDEDEQLTLAQGAAHALPVVQF